MLKKRKDRDGEMKQLAVRTRYKLAVSANRRRRMEGGREGRGEEGKREEMFRPNKLSPAIPEHNATQLPCLNVRKRNLPGSLEENLNDALDWTEAVCCSGTAKETETPVSVSPAEDRSAQTAAVAELSGVLVSENSLCKDVNQKA